MSEPEEIEEGPASTAAERLYAEYSRGMSLTMGTGPFGHAPAGSFNFDTPEEGAIFLDVIPRRVRGLKGDETVVDSRRVHMLHESRILPVWYFPEDDVRMDMLRETGHTT